MPDRVVVAISNMLFASKVEALAQAAPSPPRFMRAGESAVDLAKSESAARILLDLGDECLRPLEVVRALKSDPATRAVEVVGYARHTAAETLRAAREAGCDRVLTQGEFTRELPALLGISNPPGEDVRCL